MPQSSSSSTFGNSLSLRVDGAIGAMSLSPNGRDAVLAGRKGLFIIDLDDPFTTPRWLQHITSWEVADVQWSPHHHLKPSWCVSTSNQKALLWDLGRPSNNAIQNVLHRHTRAITDINFHPQDPELLSTCSIDTFVFTWDMRSPRRPVNKYAEWRAGATQVKWSHSNPHQIASSHHHSFYIWDSRKGALPLLKIDSAHQGKINGLDFSGDNDKLITCSNDKTIKFWDICGLSAEKSRPTIVINTAYPVARARALPFGKDNCCGIMPVRGGDDAIHIVNYNSEYASARSLGETVVMDAIPEYSFKGHHGPLKDFLWRTQHESYFGVECKRHWKEYQLVTWSPSDFDLKLWPHEKKLYDIANYNPSHQVILGPLVGTSDDSGVDHQNGLEYMPGTPETEISEDTAMKKIQQYKYDSYVVEPEFSFDGLSKDGNNDLLSKLAMFTIKKTGDGQNRSLQSNHLSWISGVRMGRKLPNSSANIDVIQNDDGPSNLGEEISIVGHKFSKVRFEKISVSTGEVEISLRGPLPISADNIDSTQSKLEEGEKKDSNDTSTVSLTKGETSVEGNNSNQSAQNTTLVSQTSSKPMAAKSSQTFSNTTYTLKTTESQGNSSGGQQQGDTSVEQKLIFIRLRIKFPKLYPFLESSDPRGHFSSTNRARRPNQVRFDIEETHELTTSVKKDMLQNLEQIAQFYSNKYNKYCLEPCLRYLMGEKIDLDDSIMMNDTQNRSESPEGLSNTAEVGNENWVDDLIEQHEAATAFAKHTSVSEDEDDEGDLISGINDRLASSLEMSQGHINTDDKKVDTSVDDGNIKHDSTPLPKGCGAVWSRNGDLVCFFIPDALDTAGNGKSPSTPKNIKFNENEIGLISVSSKQGSSHRHDDDISSLESEGSLDGTLDSEEGSFSDDSTSSTSSDDSFSKDWDEMLQDDLSSRSRIPRTFRGTVVLGKRIRLDGSNKYSYSKLIDRKASNNRSSAIEDSGSKSTKRNKKSKNARSIVTILNFKHLIEDKYELARDYRLLGDAPEVIAKHNGDVAYNYGYMDVGQAWRIVELILTKAVTLQPFLESNKEIFNFSASNFYWGNHPFGHAWLVKEIFSYFEKKQDVQMLAMLACVLYENPANVKTLDHGGLEVPVHTPYQVLPPLPSLISSKETDTQMRVSSTKSSEVHEDFEDKIKISRKPSFMSVRELHSSRPLSPDVYSQSESILKAGIMRHPSSLSQLNGSPFSKSTSQQRSIERYSHAFDNSKLVSRFSTHTRKGSKGILPKGKGPVLHKEHSIFPPAYTIEFKNVEELDLFESVFSEPLLGGVDAEKIRQYREQYADMLFTWGLPLHRVKILKFNYADQPSESKSSSFDVHKCLFGSRSRKAFNSKQSLVNSVTPIKSAKNNAWNTRKRNSIHYCGYCNLIVSKRVVICIKCEHIIHSHCASEWWCEPEGQEVNVECPTGCGCTCLTESME